MDFAKTLTGWYLRYKRNLPWRDTTDPYRIWLSEIILQQTRVAQGLPYYDKFVTLFPTVSHLARADEQQVMLAWQGLGYYSRARNLHAAARIVAYRHDGIFPDNYKDLLKLPGIGEYTAAAISSFAFGERKPVVDGNVFRVLSRIFGIEADIAKPSTRREFANLAMELMADADPATFNQAIMEFGAIRCVPTNPDCGVCPFNSVCIALTADKVNQLPVKSPKARPVDRYLNYFVLEDPSGKTTVKKRTGSGIWQHLYEFPHFETKVPASEQLMLAEATARYGTVALKEMPEHQVLHKLSHQNLYIKFARVDLDSPLDDGLSPGDLEKLPFPAVLHKFIEKHWN